MGWKVYDYQCANPECQCMAPSQMVWVEDGFIEHPCCSKCGMPMERLISAPVYHQPIDMYLESCGRVCPKECIPPKPSKEI